MTRHRDETGEPCPRHPELAEARLYELAIVGSRVPGFHHDAASKLQSLMMALDEIGELSEDADPMTRAAIETASGALRELNQLVTANRALAKPASRVRIALRELVQRAAERVGVQLRGELPACDVLVTAPAMTHVLSQLLDLAAGPSQLGHAVDITVELGDEVVLAISGAREPSKPLAHIAEVVALASYAITRDQGSLACGGESDRFVVRLPRAT